MAGCIGSNRVHSGEVVIRSTSETDFGILSDDLLNDDVEGTREEVEVEIMRVERRIN